jgi:RNA polymerase sigma-70 factor, ECF subfamily
VQPIRALGRASPVWDDHTLDACRRGDRAALGRVLGAESPALERTLSRLVGSRADVEDLVQKTFVAAIQAFPRFRGEASVRTWLVSIAVRLAQAELASGARRRRVDLVPVADLPAAGDGPERALDDRRKRERIRGHLEKVDPKKRVAFVLHVIEGRPIEEVAALVGASRAATKSRVFFARRQLVKRLRADPLLCEIFGPGEGRR